MPPFLVSESLIKSREPETEGGGGLVRRLFGRAYVNVYI